ncbi:major facilitator superfamily protein [Pelomyxa schiedti]|nr:major facilitator superfamily protein [Pelomyxa schiedti]
MKKHSDVEPKSWYIILLFMSWMFGYAVVQTSLASILLPLEIREIQPTGAAALVSIVGGISIIFSLTGIIVVYWSDTCTSRLGRRRPFILIATVIAIIGVFGFLIGSVAESVGVLITGYMIAISGLSLGTSVMSALLPDLTPQSQHGLASGLMTTHSLLGSAIGYSFAAFALPTTVICIIYIIVLIVFTVPTIIFAKEKQWKLRDSTIQGKRLLGEEGEIQEGNEVARKIKNGCQASVFAFRDFFKAYLFSPKKHPDFLLSLVMGGCFFMSASVMVYLQYWIGDIICAPEPASVTAILSLISLFASLVAALPTGPLSDKLGRRPLILVALFIVAVALASFAVVPDMTWVYVVATGYGIGNGIFRTLSYAVTCDTLPSKVASGKYMAMGTLVMICGTTLSQVIVGFMLEAFNTPSTSCPVYSSSSSSLSALSPSSSTSASLSSEETEHYSRTGYNAVFMLCCGFTVCSAVAAVFINTNRGKRAQQVASPEEQPVMTADPDDNN